MTLEQFNKQFIYKEDIKKFGFVEVWDIPKLQSDEYCKIIVYFKREYRRV